MAKAGSVKVVYDGLAKFKEGIKALNTTGVLVGIPKSNGERQPEKGEDDFDNMSNAAIGYIQEKGSDIAKIPPRPFLVPGVRAVKKEIAMEMEKMAREAFNNPGAVYKRYNRMGIIAMNSVKRTLTKGDGYDKLSERTLAERKEAGFKGTKPLIRTGQLRNSITYVIQTGNE